MGAAGGILFDKDGTLLDFQKTWADLAVTVADELSQGDEAIRIALADASGLDLATRRFRPHSPLVSGSAPDVVAAWTAILPQHDAVSLIEYLNTKSQAIDRTHLAPAARDLPALLDRFIAAGFTLGVATHDSEDAARAQMAALGVETRFAFIAGYDSGFAAKPDRAMLDGFCAAVGVAPSTVVVVGDSLHDLGMGRSGGARASIGVLTGVADADMLAPLADIVLDDIDALPGYLGL